MPKFSKASADRLSHAHPLLQHLMNEAIKQADFVILDSQRGRADQEKAVKAGNSKVHYGDSAHNWTPALALDIAPYPIDWNDSKRFTDLQINVILPTAKRLGIPIRQGVDFNMNGNLTDDKWDDLPHVELNPWREFAKKAEPFDP